MEEIPNRVPQKIVEVKPILQKLGVPRKIVEEIRNRVPQEIVEVKSILQKIGVPQKIVEEKLIPQKMEIQQKIVWTEPIL